MSPHKRIPQVWRVIGVQSSAPGARVRQQENNLALALTSSNQQLVRWMSHGNMEMERGINEKGNTNKMIIKINDL